jgi:hypothetical protein
LSSASDCLKSWGIVIQNIVNTKLDKRPLSSKAIEAMKPSDKIMSDSGENTGLRIKCGLQKPRCSFIGIRTLYLKHYGK